MFIIELRPVWRSPPFLGGMTDAPQQRTGADCVWVQDRVSVQDDYDVERDKDKDKGKD